MKNVWPKYPRIVKLLLCNMHLLNVCVCCMVTDNQVAKSAMEKFYMNVEISTH